MAETEKISKIPTPPIDEPVTLPVPIDEPIDLPVGEPTPGATIIVGDEIDIDELESDIASIKLPPNEIEGSDSPEIIFSTPGDDLVLAKGGDDTILGSLGDDTYVGGDGFDTLDYTDLGEKITLLPRGFIGNGSSQGSQIQDIERIIGAPKKDNTIDGSGGFGTPVSFTIDLSDDLLIVNDIPTLGDVEFVVENFRNVQGTENADSITGSNRKNLLSGNGGDDTLIGKFGRDTLLGGAGNDTLIGADPDVRDTVKRERDILTGGAGRDTFVLGNELGSFYDDFGKNDFARITDFSFGEIIKLSSEETYTVERNNRGFNIFEREEFGRDLIAKVRLPFSAATTNSKSENNSSAASARSARSANDSLMAASTTESAEFEDLGSEAALISASSDPAGFTQSSADALLNSLTEQEISLSAGEKLVLDGITFEA